MSPSVPPWDMHSQVPVSGPGLDLGALSDAALKTGIISATQTIDMPERSGTMGSPSRGAGLEPNDSPRATPGSIVPDAPLKNHTTGNSGRDDHGWGRARA